jgi:hypothetical protein
LTIAIGAGCCISNPAVLLPCFFFGELLIAKRLHSCHNRYALHEVEGMSAQPDKEETIRIPFWAIVLLVIVLGGTALFLLQQSNDRPKVAAAFVCISIMAALITFGALGASAQIRTKTAQFGGSAAILVALLVLLRPFIPSSAITISGYLRLDNDKGPLAKGVKVHLLGNGFDPNSISDDNGLYSFSEIDGGKENQHATVTIDEPPAGYAPAQRDVQLISQGSWDVIIPALAPPGAPPASVTTHPALPASAVVPSQAVLEVIRNNDVVQFTFEYTSENPGPRNWKRGADGNWLEMAPHNAEQVYISESRTTVAGDEGWIVRQQKQPDFTIFIPDKNAKLPWLQYQWGTTGWHFLAKMYNVS